MPNNPRRLSPDEIRRIQEAEKTLEELKKVLENNYRFILALQQVQQAFSDGNDTFSVLQNRIAMQKVNTILKQSAGKFDVILLNAIQKEWELTNENYWKGLKTVFGKTLKEAKYFDEIRKKATANIRSSADESRSFYNQKRGGVTISDRVWKLHANIPMEMDAMVQNAIKQGKSADELSRNLGRYLNKPDKIFRKVRNKKTGELEWSEAAKQYNPGRGVYRSSYKNAMRLSRTEINRAYRFAEWHGYQNNIQIYGYEIVLSNNTENQCEVCKRLAGVYPKWFLWTGWHPQCYSDDTELMTNNGWKLFENLHKDDLIFSLNPETKQPEWVKFVKFIKYHRKGKMYQFHNRNLDMLVTPDHKMIYVNKSDGKTLMDNKVAEEFTPTMGGLYRSSDYAAESIEKIKIGKHDIDFNLFTEFMAYYLAEGSLFWTRRNQIKISQCRVKHQKQYETIKSCLEKMPFAFSEIQGGFYFNDPDFYEYLKQFGKSPEKHIPAGIKNSSPEQMRIFLDAYVICDGLTKKAKSFVGNRGGLHTPKNDEKTYFTSSKKMAADIGELLVKMGKRPSYRFSAKKGEVKTHRNGDYITNNDNIIISECNSKTATVYQKTEVNYDGFVYDIELEKNHIFYVRRNGKCVWGSNCRCRMVPILMPKDDWARLLKMRFEGREKDFKPAFIENLPSQFIEYLQESAERINNAATLPYWFEDNEERLRGYV